MEPDDVAKTYKRQAEALELFLSQLSEGELPHPQGVGLQVSIT